MNHPLTEKIWESKPAVLHKFCTDSIIRQWLEERKREIEEIRRVGKWVEKDLNKILGLSDEVDVECSCGASGGTYKHCTVCSKPKPSSSGECFHAFMRTDGMVDDWKSPRQYWFECSRCKFGKYMSFGEWIQYNLSEPPRQKQKTLAEKFQNFAKSEGWRGWGNWTVYWDSLAEIAEKHFKKENG